MYQPLGRVFNHILRNKIRRNPYYLPKSDDLKTRKNAINTFKIKNRAIYEISNDIWKMEYEKSPIPQSSPTNNNSGLRIRKKYKIGDDKNYWSIIQYNDFPNVMVVEMDSNPVNCFSNAWIDSFNQMMDVLECQTPRPSLILKSKSKSVFSSGMDLKIVKNLQKMHHDIITEICSTTEPSEGCNIAARQLASEILILDYLEKYPQVYETLINSSYIDTKPITLDSLIREVLNPLEPIQANVDQFDIPYTLSYDHIKETINYIKSFNECFLRLLTYKSATFSSVEGIAIAGGFALSLATDGVIYQTGAKGSKLGLHARSLGFTFPSSIHYTLSKRFTRPVDSFQIQLIGRIFQLDNLPPLNSHLAFTSFEKLVQIANDAATDASTLQLKSSQIDDLQNSLKYHHPAIQLRFLFSFLNGLGV